MSAGDAAAARPVDIAAGGVTATREVGGALVVRRATPHDAPAYARIMGDPAVYPGLMQMPYADEATWRDRILEMSGKHDLLLVAERGGEVVGTAGLHAVSSAQRRRHALLVGISVAPASQRKGVGSALMAAMCDYADRWVGALRLELSVYTDNVAAIALYRKFGFVIEGTMRGYALRDGRYVDAHAMARIHPAPPGIGPLPPAP
ncbi:MAG TPA: GNAT family N-acetyltransferase [Caldimonas sp.]|nr:GNAT family N-acetyltransferase [Caldimonas sp.]